MDKSSIERINEKAAELSKTIDWSKEFTIDTWIDLVNTALDESDLQFDKGYRQGYIDGYIDALTNYAVWRDGVQYVGVLQTPLKELIEKVKTSDIPIRY